MTTRPHVIAGRAIVVVLPAEGAPFYSVVGGPASQAQETFATIWADLDAASPAAAAAVLSLCGELDALAGVAV